MADLAKAEEPLRLADGTLVYPDGRVERPKKDIVEVPSAHEAQKFVASARRHLADIPAPPKSANAISVILSYTLFGLQDDEIAVATNLSVSQIGQIKMLDAYQVMYDAVIRQIIDKDADDVRRVFVAGAKKAASKMVGFVDSDDPAIAITASRDLLDRAGHRPVDVVDHRIRMDESLKIEIIHSDRTKEAPTIDIGT